MYKFLLHFKLYENSFHSMLCTINFVEYNWHLIHFHIKVQLSLICGLFIKYVFGDIKLSSVTSCYMNIIFWVVKTEMKIRNFIRAIVVVLQERITRRQHGAERQWQRRETELRKAERQPPCWRIGECFSRSPLQQRACHL